MTTHLNRKRGLVWFRRDLRLDDNPAWAAATAAHDEVIALFVIEPALMNTSGSIRRDQLLAHLHALDAELRERGGALVVRNGPAVTAIPGVIGDGDASALYYDAAAGPFTAARDEATNRAVDVPVHVLHGLTVHEPGAVLPKKGTLSQVFTPFYKTWRSTTRKPWPSGGPGRPVTVSGRPIPVPQHSPRHEPGPAWSSSIRRWSAPSASR